MSDDTNAPYGYCPMCGAREAIEWVGHRSLRRAFKDCQRGDWMLRFARTRQKELGVTDDQLWHIACDCAERVLRFIPAGEARSRNAIEARRAWLRGEIGDDELAAAARSVIAAKYAAEAAADAAGYAAHAAACAVEAAACAAEYAVDALFAGAERDKELAAQADIIRKYIRAEDLPRKLKARVTR